MEKDIVIVDAEFQSEVKQIKDMCTKMDKMLSFLHDYMEKSVDSMRGNVARNLDVLAKQTDGLKGNFEYVSKQCDEITTKFIKEIDDADRWLYDK